MSDYLIEGIIHPYVRISKAEQRKGGGLERQTKADMEAFVRRYGGTLSKRLWIDDGVSAWKGLNATPDHELGKFIAEANVGLIRPGDCLLVENYDRLSRENPWAASALINELRNLRIHIGRLDRLKLLRYDSTDAGDFFEYAIEIMRGHSESNMKSYRNTEGYERLRKAAREKGTIITANLPAWMEVRDGKPHVIPERAAAIKYIFHLSASLGLGGMIIARRLIKEGVLAFGKSGKWTKAYVDKLLDDPRVIGEFQPKLTNGEPAGDVIKYPAAISEEEWYAVRAGREERRGNRGRRSEERVNVFQGLLKDALGGGSYYTQTRTHKGRRWCVLVNYTAIEGQDQMRSFPFETFEKAILEKLREIDPHEILNGNTGPDETIVLAGQLAETKKELQEAKDWMKNNKFSPTIAERIAELEDLQKDQAAKLAEARQRAAHPLSEAWGESKTLVDVIYTCINPDEVRLRLQSVLRRMIASIQIVVVPHGHDRLAAVQIWFKDEKKHRDYLILHRPPKGNASARTEGGWWCKSMVNSDLPGVLDLRNSNDARELEEVLAQMKFK